MRDKSEKQDGGYAPSEAPTETNDLGDVSLPKLPGEATEQANGTDEVGDLEKATPTSAPPAFNPADFPDGGAKAWLVVAGCWCCLFVSFGWINCIGVFQAYYQTHMLSQYAPSTVAWIPSLEAFMMFAGGAVIGKIYDNYGPFYLLVTGTFFHVFGLMMTSLATEYYQFILAQGICSALGASMVFYPAMTSLTSWFFHKRAFALGIVASGSSMGGVIFPIMVQRLIPQIGFPWTMRACAFMILGLCIIAILTVKSRLPPVKKPLNLIEFVLPLKEPPYVLLTLGSFLFFLGLFLPFNFLILQGPSIGMSQNLAGYLIPILNAASVFGRTIPGYVADKVGRFNVLTVMCAFSGIIILALWLPAAANAPLIVFAALYGFGSGAFVSAAPSCVAQISDVRKIGVRTGTLFGIVSIAVLISNPIGGALVDDDHGKYRNLQIYAGVICCGGAAVLGASRFVQSGPKLVVKI
ncbi:MFS general substrate transporter [Viridothelium virens]|uniref:MFS general substrate transporter n=1 Tax=Viridothelium virens TaxID=1048519 RepID=A0A6A6HHF8_VIRVR|nr:MFS general substrate transporter [Viridothelium virens]